MLYILCGIILQMFIANIKTTTNIFQLLSTYLNHLIHSGVLGLLKGVLN